MLGHSRTPAGITPIATSASHPSAAMATVSNCAATNSLAGRGRSAADGDVAPVTDEHVIPTPIYHTYVAVGREKRWAEGPGLAEFGDDEAVADIEFVQGQQ
jgi:hypothetical protein